MCLKVHLLAHTELAVLSTFVSCAQKVLGIPVLFVCCNDGGHGQVCVVLYDSFLDFSESYQIF